MYWNYLKPTKYCKAGSLEVCEQLGLGEDRAALVSSSTRFFALDGLVASQVARRSAEVTVADLEFPAISRKKSLCWIKISDINQIEFYLHDAFHYHGATVNMIHALLALQWLHWLLPNLKSKISKFIKIVWNNFTEKKSMLNKNSLHFQISILNEYFPWILLSESGIYGMYYPKQKIREIDFFEFTSFFGHNNLNF